MPDARPVQQLKESAPPCVDDVRMLMEYEGGQMGYYAKGHIDPVEFAAAIQWSYDDMVPVESIRQEWWRNVPANDGYGGMMFHPAAPGSRGAYRVTVSEDYVTPYVAQEAPRVPWPVPYVNCRVLKKSGRDRGCDGSCGMTPCKRCEGTGNELLWMYRKCQDCAGAGHLAMEVDDVA